MCSSDLMSEITAPRPEVVNGHTDVICSTSIRHILAVRKSTLLQIDTLIRQLAEISAMTESIGGKTAPDWAMKQDFRCGCWLMEKPETAMKAITRNLDREIWRDLMQRSGMLSLMDAQARDTWYRSLEYDNFTAKFAGAIGFVIPAQSPEDVDHPSLKHLILVLV